MHYTLGLWDQIDHLDIPEYRGENILAELGKLEIEGIMVTELLRITDAWDG